MSGSALAIGIGLSVGSRGVERCGDTDAWEPAPDRSWSATPSPGPLAPTRQGVALRGSRWGREALSVVATRTRGSRPLIVRGPRHHHRDRSLWPVRGQSSLRIRGSTAILASRPPPELPVMAPLPTNAGPTPTLVVGLRAQGGAGAAGATTATPTPRERGPKRGPPATLSQRPSPRELVPDLSAVAVCAGGAAAGLAHRPQPRLDTLDILPMGEAREGQLVLIAGVAARA